MRPTTVSITRLASVALIAALALTACGSDSDDADSDATASSDSSSSESSPDDADSKAEIALIKDGQFTVCTQFPYEPFEYREDGEATGFDVDLANQIGEDLGADKTEYLSTAFEGISSGQDLAAKKCDMAVGAITITEKREEAMLFGDPYFDAKQALLTKKDAGINDLSDLSGKKLGVQAGTTGEIYAKENAKDAEVVSFDDIAGQTTAVVSGKVDAIMNDNVPLIGFAQKNDETTVTKEFDTGEKYGFAVAKDNTALKAQIDESLQEMRDNGKYDELYDKYFAVESK